VQADCFVQPYTQTAVLIICPIPIPRDVGETPCSETPSVKRRAAPRRRNAVRRSAASAKRRAAKRRVGETPATKRRVGELTCSRAAPPATIGGGAQIRPVGAVALLLRKANGWATICAAIRPTYEAFVIDSEESSHLPGMSSTTPTVLYLSNYDISNILNGLLVAGMPIIMRRVVVDNNSTDFTAPALPPVLPINFETNPNVPAGFDGNWGTQSETWN